jgi:peroxiredoxin (alkyl hydroperoxide reductase subunit C)
VSIIAPGTPAPEFTLKTVDGEAFTRDDLAGKTTVLVFYPFAFSSVCTDQFQIYQEVLWDFTEQGATLYGVSTDAPDSQRAFRESLGLSINMLSDFHPKGETAKAFGAYWEPGGMATRALVIVGPDQVVQWSWIGEHPGILPGANLIFDGLAARAA